MRYLLLLGVLLASLRPALAQRLVARQVALGANQSVKLDLKYARQIRVRPGSGPGLLVQAHVTIADHQLDQTYDLAVTTTGDEVVVDEKLDKELLARTWRQNWHDRHRPDDQPDQTLHVDYDVTLPATMPLTIRTIAGDIDAQDLAAAVNLKSISGELRLTGLRGPVVARAISGDIHLTGLPGQATVSAESISGDVEANWPPNSAADLTLKSLSGEVYADSSVTFSNLKARHYVGYTLHGHTGRPESGPLVSLSSISGDVFFRRR